MLPLKDGHVFERYSQPQLIGGQSVGRVWSFRDVSERERGAEALRRSETLKAAILDTALDCIITMDGAGRVVEWNPAAEKTFGFARSQVLGQLLGELIVPPALRERHYAGLQHYLGTGIRQLLGRRAELPGVRADGSELMVELSIVQIAVEGGSANEGGPLFIDLINEVLDIARIEAGRLSLSPEPVWVSMAVREVLDLARPLAEGRRI